MDDCKHNSVLGAFLTDYVKLLWRIFWTASYHTKFWNTCNSYLTQTATDTSWCQIHIINTGIITFDQVNILFKFKYSASLISNDFTRKLCNNSHEFLYILLDSLHRKSHQQAFIFHYTLQNMQIWTNWSVFSSHFYVPWHNFSRIEIKVWFFFFNLSSWWLTHTFFHLFPILFLYGDKHFVFWRTELVQIATLFSFCKLQKLKKQAHNFHLPVHLWSQLVLSFRSI